MRGLVEHFARLENPRVERAKRHSLLALVTLAVVTLAVVTLAVVTLAVVTLAVCGVICGVICGAESWVEIEQFGRAKADWFKTVLDLPHGIPSHDPFGRVFARLDARAFEGCFAEWISWGPVQVVWLLYEVPIPPAYLAYLAEVY